MSDEEARALVRFKAELARWNERMDLTGLEEEADVLEKHFLDSLGCWLGGWVVGGARVIDVGSGAGFPGLVLAITGRRVPGGFELSLLESSERKVAFLRHVCGVLGLSWVRVIQGRAEAVGRDAMYRERFEVAVARAVAPLAVVAEYCLPLVRAGGWFLAMKGARAEEEVGHARRAIEVLGGEVAALTWYRLPFCGRRRAVVAVRKVGPAPAKYPRRPGMPAKRPL